MAQPDRPASVQVTDIDMPFTSMVWFMIKWALASIPALLILMIFGVFAVMVLGGMLRGIH